VQDCSDPIAASGVDAEATAPSKQCVGPTTRILILDDDPFALKVLRQMLALQGYQAVSTCETGRAALSRIECADNVPELILCDLNMPEMDGAEFVRELVGRHYVGSLVLVSGESERMIKAAETLARAHSIRVLGHLSKPVASDALKSILCALTVPPKRSALSVPLRNHDEVRAAIHGAELVNFYQPKVAVQSGRVVGVETLVRWQHPRDGIVLPDQFIAVAEQHGLINDLTRVVVKAALCHAEMWRANGLTLGVAVNVSMDTLGSLDFPDLMAAHALSAGIAPQRVTIEVTESRLMGDLRAPLEVLTRLRLKGFRLSIDDFGTGHSSLVKLRDLPFDELKVDRGFVHLAGTDPTIRAIYDASLGLGNRLGMDVVAEGVEDRDDWNFVRRSGCQFAQGYYIGKPMPAADLPGWISEWQGRLKSE
jgi:EAL domain-containing protein (putative c-di-GMP-specific phosphodiesterase class I)/ActR/RegA family two-component response regulator